MKQKWSPQPKIEEVAKTDVEVWIKKAAGGSAVACRE